MAQATDKIRAKIRLFAQAGLGAGAPAVAALPLWQAVPRDRA